MVYFCFQSQPKLVMALIWSSSTTQTSSLGNAGQLFLIGRIKLEGCTWLQVPDKIPSTGRGVATGTEVGVITHLAIFQKWVE